MYRPSCTVNLPDGTSYNTPSDTVVHVLQDWPIFNIRQALPHEDIVQITIPTITSDLAFKVETQNEPTSIGEVFGKYDMLDFALFLVSTLGPIILMILLAVCFYPRFKRWTLARMQPNIELHKPAPKEAPQKHFWYDLETGRPIPPMTPILKTTSL